MAQSNGGIIGTLNTPSQNGAPGVWTSRDMELAQKANLWPQTAYQYQIARSLRFNSADSAYLNRTPASAGNKQTWTLSVWMKRGGLSAFMPIYSAGPVSPRAWVIFNSSDKLDFRSVDSGNTEVIRLTTTQVFRDPSAWYHIVVAQDTTQATSSNRVKIYVNGTQITAFDTATYPSQNTSNLAINDALEQNFGRYVNSPSDGYLSAYLADVRFIDGQALTPTSFGENNADTGVWQGKTYAGTYGTNGFWLKFADNSNTTAATLGADSSGNGNNWTPNNFSVTAGAGNDSLVDSPTSYGIDAGSGGTVRGNYATWNALVVNKPTLTNGNLDADGSDLKTAISTMGVSSGKWYWEILIRSGTDTPNMGVTSFANDKADPGVYLGVGRSYVSSGGGGGVYKSYTATSTTADSDFSNANTAGATIGFALDCDAGTLSYYVNNVLAYTDSTIATGTLLYPMTCNFNSGANAYRNTSVNFGQRPFAYTAPSGFKALCTQNLPTPAVGATAGNLAGNHMNTVTFTGNSTIPRAITGFGFAPDLLWNIRRDVSYGIQIFDAVRGAGYRLNTGYSSLATAPESSGYGLVNSFDADGFTINAVDQASNNSGGSYAVWGWNTGTTNVTNTNGTITSTVRANPTAGMSVVTYTNASSGTVGHGLGAVPAMVIYKDRVTSGVNWVVLHQSLLNMSNYYLTLNTPNAVASGIALGGNPTSSVIYTSTTLAGAVATVAYCFAEIAGFSKFGSYVGNNSADGPFVYCGFRPRWVMVKDAGNSSWPWWIVDIVRNTVNPISYYMTANTESVETNNFAGNVIMDAVSNGFKMRSSDAYGNTSGETYIFAAFAEFPFKYSLAR